jgi:CRISPR-associated protein Cas5h
VRVAAFDVWGDYAHFRKIYTTTSPLTYSIPPRTALIGLVSAILGYRKEDYLKQMGKDKASIGVGLLAEVKKTRLAENLIDTDKTGRFNLIKNRTQIRFEMLRNPRFRVYFSHIDTDTQRALVELLKEHKCVFTLCLGLSELLADYKYVGEYDGSIIYPKEPVRLASSILENQVEELIFEKDYQYITETLPLDMAPDRTVLEYGSVLFERGAKQLQARVRSCTQLSDGSVIAFL